MEFNLGNKTQKSAPLAYKSIHPKLESVGWFQTILSFSVSTYYNVILAYVALYTLYSMSLAWGTEPQTYFYNDVLGFTNAIGAMGDFAWHIAIAFSFLWLIVGLISVTGIKNGVEKMNKIIIPLLLLMFTSVVIYALTLPGAITGLNAFFTPDFSRLNEAKIWLNAYTQVFFSLSVGFGNMITYASYTNKKEDVTSVAITTAFGNSSVELLAGIGIFAALGFMATSKGIPIQEIASTGVGLTFFVIPEVLNAMPYGAIIGVLFFGSLLLAGISSVVSVVEVVVAALSQKWNWKRKPTIIGIVCCGWTLGLLFLFGNGLILFNIFDHAINNIALIIGGLLEIGLLVFVYKKIPEIVKYTNKKSILKLNKTFILALAFTFVMLIVIFSVNLYEEFFDPKYPDGYGNLGKVNNIIFGILPIIGVGIASLIASKSKTKTNN